VSCKGKWRLRILKKDLGSDGGGCEQKYLLLAPCSILNSICPSVFSGLEEAANAIRIRASDARFGFHET
jgi:hypothetical protein